ncbi:hypothetical protein PoB_004360500 [Plakobranchus ocellatus]|uniref:Uncharacterized protein n=1 Tax=Plakobranchus ocellatus TaxID=259542 RepID=A0AAV4BDC8_9GAST|nr:hypothetical protein PoB_004360500 [Plakobranchus ocellatus]
MGCMKSKSVLVSSDNSVRPDTKASTIVSLPQTASKLSMVANNTISVDAGVYSSNPMDERQMFKIKQSWKGIRRNMELTGVEMFVR